MRVAIVNMCSDDAALVYADGLTPGMLDMADALNAAGSPYSPRLDIIELPDGHDLYDCKGCEWEPVTCKAAKQLTAPRREEPRP